jgi:hypothetical protein
VKVKCGVHFILITPVSVASRRATGWTAKVGFAGGAGCFSSLQRPVPLPREHRYLITTRIAIGIGSYEQARITEAIKDINQVKNRCELEYTHHSCVRGV